MGKVLAVAKYDIIKMTRDKGTLLLIFMLPAVFTFVMGLVFGNITGSDGVYLVPVAVASYDEGTAADAVIEELARNDNIRVMVMDEEKLRDGVKDNSLELGFIIPRDFSRKIEDGDTAHVNVVKLPSSADFAMLEGLFHSAFLKVTTKDRVIRLVDENLEMKNGQQKDKFLERLEDALDENIAGPDAVTVISSRYSNRETVSDYDPKAQISLGFMVMFVMLTIFISAGEILDERKIHTWDRLSAAPVTKAQVILGKITGTFARGWIQVIFMLLFGSLVMGVNFGNSLLSTAILMSVYLLSITGIGLFIATLVKTNAQLGPVSAIFTMSTSMMSGLWWPIEIEPLFMQKIAVFFPQYWVMKGLRRLVVAGSGLGSVAGPLAILAGMGVVFFMLASVRERKKV